MRPVMGRDAISAADKYFTDHLPMQACSRQALPVGDAQRRRASRRSLQAVDRDGPLSRFEGRKTLVAVDARRS